MTREREADIDERRTGESLRKKRMNETNQERTRAMEREILGVG